jgi:hypothetical protein
LAKIFDSLQWIQSFDNPTRLAQILKSRKIVAEKRNVHTPFLTALDHYFAAAEKPTVQQQISREDEMYLYSDFIIAPYRMERE